MDGTVQRMKAATLVTAVALALVPTAGIGIALGAGPDQGYTDFRTETSAATEVLPGAGAAALAACDPGERAAGGGFDVAGEQPGVEVIESRRVALAENVSGWAVTFRNHSAAERLVTARAVCESA